MTLAMRRYTQFQLTHSRGVRRLYATVECIFAKFQLTHSRGVRLLAIFAKYSCSTISTHALTWSATVKNATMMVGQTISTHALTWSATPVLAVFRIRTATFQLTHSRGVRQLYLDSLCDPDNFNSRTHVECDSRK